MIVDPASEIKTYVSARAVADRYGLPVDHAGFALCPWHNEATASLKVYDGNRGYYCFGCHASGDAISLARKLLGTSFRDTLHILNKDFGLNISLVGESPVARVKRQAEWLRESKRRQEVYECAEGSYMDALDKWIAASSAVDKHRPVNPDDDFTGAFCQALIDREQASADMEEAEKRWARTRLQA